MSDFTITPLPLAHGEGVLVVARVAADAVLRVYGSSGPNVDADVTFANEFAAMHMRLNAVIIGASRGRARTLT